ncbi:MAG TPA: NUDIX hydrolase [Myxococcota bacterium]|nr:NUDIX hydrolase [Myxococcota bacterium]
MDDLDPFDLSDVLVKLLQGATPGEGVTSDADGWFPLADVCLAVSVVMRRDVGAAHMELLTRAVPGFEILDARIRIASRPHRHRPPSLPDILFHASTAAALTRAWETGVLAAPPRRRLLLSNDEPQAWRVAHRLAWQARQQGDGAHGSLPRVAIIDVPRARRAGVRFQTVRPGMLWSTTTIPVAHILNLRRDFDAQLSAGGIPIRRFPDGQVRLALIRVTRRSGRTWEVAKGKMEPGETPEVTAIREVQEEMGIQARMRVLRYIAPVRYGFLAPGGAPRLKTIFLYLLEPLDAIEAFAPAGAEGIGEVRWFTPDEAVEAVSHPSLQPVMRRARELVTAFGLTPAHPSAG